MDINLKTLIGKLNDTTRTAATRAGSICVGLGHYEVDIDHLFLALLEQPDSDFVRIARECGISMTGLETDLRNEISRLRSGSGRTPVFSKHLPALFEHAWLIASLGGGGPNQIRSGHLLLALLTEPDLAQLALRGSRLFAEIPLFRLKHDFDQLTRGSNEACATPSDFAGADPVGELAGAAHATPALDQFTTCLTQRARDGQLDPVIGRDAEIRQAIDILMRRRQNNPILTGEAGVGKTAVVEGLALRIVRGDVPDVLREVEIHTLDMGLLQAGASVKGEFENRLKNVIAEVKKSPRAIILFIDEAHTMIGAGGAAGQNDAANLLKPALARGELRTIAATTWSEYKKYFEKDAALARRFQVVKVEEPSEEIACAMLRAMAPLMEKHFGVRVYDDAITEAVRLSHRYISGRQLPDKAISVLDTACAKVALGQSATPALIEAAARQLERIDAQTAALTRDECAGADHGATLATLRARRVVATDEHRKLQQRWDKEQSLNAEIKTVHARLEAGGAPSDSAALRALIAELRMVQGEAPLVPVQVDGHVVAEIVAAWTGIPLGRMVKDEIRTVMNLQAPRRNTSRAFYAALMADTTHCMAAIAELEPVVDQRLGADGPGFSAARSALQGIVHAVTPAAREAGALVEGDGGGAAEAELIVLDTPSSQAGPGPLQTRAQAQAQLRLVAEFFRRTEPHSPVAYLADKAAAWGEQPLHVWLRGVVKDQATCAHLEELLGVDGTA